MSAKEIVSRAVKTFIQAGVSYLVVNFSAIAFDFADMDAMTSAVTTLAVAALAAGISAVWNGVISPLIDKSMEEDENDGNSDD